ncbi:nuclear transport factor 2 family protein [Brevundimonas lutea]|uniref:nuclear transport factor 2 family protein n=1 Tax=Brevundimonas lutea TaxID=2293980 RepID=UPI000F038C4B|nr:nuclear transport factor 2 family protein [Brevundimonas lutea]
MISALILSAALALQPPTEAAPSAPVAAVAETGAEAEVGRVLDQLHATAASADEAVYFDLFTPSARFIGTDATERWTMTEFRAFAEPYFQRDTAWTYRARERVIDIAPSGDVAWFDERLDNASYGETRGSGVLVRTDDGWKIAQYVLSFAVPNAVADDVVARIRQGEP